MQIKNNLRDAIEVLLWLQGLTKSRQVKRILDDAICHIAKEVL